MVGKDTEVERPEEEKTKKKKKISPTLLHQPKPESVMQGHMALRCPVIDAEPRHPSNQMFSNLQSSNFEKPLGAAASIFSAQLKAVPGSVASLLLAPRIHSSAFCALLDDFPYPILSSQTGYIYILPRKMRRNTFSSLFSPFSVNPIEGCVRKSQKLSSVHQNHQSFSPHCGASSGCLHRMDTSECTESLPRGGTN